MDVRVKLDDSRSNGYRYIRGADFASNEPDDVYPNSEIGSWVIRSQDYSFLGTNSLRLVYSLSGRFVPWTFRSVDHSFPTYDYSKKLNRINFN